MQGQALLDGQRLELLHQSCGAVGYCPQAHRTVPIDWNLPSCLRLDAFGTSLNNTTLIYFEGGRYTLRFASSPQENELTPGLTVREQIELGAEFRKCKPHHDAGKNHQQLENGFVPQLKSLSCLVFTCFLVNQAPEVFLANPFCTSKQICIVFQP